jgi:hypothetical protein
MLTIERVLTLLAAAAQVLGMITFGVTTGWFTLYAFHSEEKTWQLQGLVFSVFLLFVALLARASSPGALGGFLLGAAAAFIFWGIIKGQKEEE